MRINVYGHGLRKDVPNYLKVELVKMYPGLTEEERKKFTKMQDAGRDLSQGGVSCTVENNCCREWYTAG